MGGYWTRTNDPEIDIVAADRAPIAEQLTAVGSIKWLEQRAFDDRDLISHRAQLPGADETTPLIAVSRTPAHVEPATMFGPEELLAAWA